jgi:hypothetical protein
MTNRLLVAALLAALACASGADGGTSPAAREAWLSAYSWEENVTAPVLDHDSATRVEAAFWRDGPTGVIVTATEPFCGLAFSLQGAAPMRPSVSTPREVLIYAHDGTAGMTRSGDLTWSRPAVWPAGNHWVPASDQRLYAVAVSLLLAGTDREDHALVDVIDVDVIPCR